MSSVRCAGGTCHMSALEGLCPFNLKSPVTCDVSTGSTASCKVFATLPTKHFSRPTCLQTWRAQPAVPLLGECYLPFPSWASSTYGHRGLLNALQAADLQASPGSALTRTVSAAMKRWQIPKASPVFETLGGTESVVNGAL